MSLNATEIASQLSRLAGELQGARLSRSHQTDTQHLVLDLKPPSKPGIRLLLCTGDRVSRICTTESMGSKPKNPMAFQMLLRSRVDGSRIREVAQLPGERIIRFHFHNGATLVAELTGRHGNVGLLGEDGCILGLMRLSRKRGLALGEPYTSPSSEPPKPGADRFSSDPDVRGFYAELEITLSVEDLRSKQLSQTRGAIKRTRRALKAVQGDLERARKAEMYLRYADALKTSLHTLQRGQEVASVTDYSTGEPAELEVPLKPELSPQENMARYYRLYRKFQGSTQRIVERMELLTQTLATLTELIGQIESAPDMEALQELGVDIDMQVPRRPAPRTPEARARAWRTYRSLSERNILVGRSARHNDELTFRHARGNDLWLHVKEYPGSHIVIPLAKTQTADKDTLIDAAHLAIHFSRAPAGATCEVAYTHVKNLRKPKGSPPGVVTYRGEKTLRITEDEERVKRLKSALVAE